MPELPDILLYLHALEPRIVGRRIDAIELGSPFLLRSVEPRLDRAVGRTVEGLRRLGMPVHRTEDEIGATLADAVVAAALDVRIGDPLLEVARTMFDAAGTPIAYQWTVASPQVWRMLITFDGDGR